MSTDGPQNLRWWMDERRGELGLTWQQAADRAGVSTETLYRAAEGRAMRTTTRKGLERALRWQPGSVDAILRGAGPEPLPAENVAGRLDADAAVLTEQIRELLSQQGLRLTERRMRKVLEHIDIALELERRAEASRRVAETPITPDDDSHEDSQR